MDNPDNLPPLELSPQLQDNRLLLEQVQLDNLSQLVAFRANPWYNHFIALLDIEEKRAQTIVFEKIPHDMQTEKAREQAIGEHRAYGAFAATVSAKYDELVDKKNNLDKPKE